MDTSEPLNKSQLAASSSKDSSIRKDIDNSGSGKCDLSNYLLEISIVVYNYYLLCLYEYSQYVNIIPIVRFRQ